MEIENKIVEVAPYWNVNFNNKLHVNFKIVVEVAPYWNVNALKDVVGTKLSKVEVAPYWNVNLIVLYYLFTFTIGRSSTILECKCIQ